MNCFHTLVSLVCMAMAIVAGSQDSSNDLYIGAAGDQSMLDIGCPDDTVLTVMDAWFGNSVNCTMAIADDTTVNGTSVCCRNVMPYMEAFIIGYEYYYGVQDSNALINWVSTDVMGGDDCPGVPKNLWVLYDCENQKPNSTQQTV